MSKLIRIHENSYNKLIKLEKLKKLSKSAIIEEALESLARDYLLDAANESYRAMKKNKKNWENELDERAEWDRALLDGLKDV